MEPMALFADIARTLGAVSLQSAVLGAVALAVDLVVRGLSARFRFWLWFVVLARLCIPLPLSLPGPVHEFLTGWMEREPAEEMVELDGIDYGMQPIPLEEPPYDWSFQQPAITDTPPPETGFSFPAIPTVPIAGMLWLAGVVAFAAIITGRTRHMLGIVRASETVDRADITEVLAGLSKTMGIRGAVEVCMVADSLLATPAAVGALRPRILLPRSLAVDWPAAELTPVLLHELAHIRRRDLWVNWLQIVLQAVWFFHPAVWYANHRLRRLREELCDDLAVSYGGLSSAAYSRSIVKVVEHIAAQPSFGLVGLCIAERRSGAERRIRRLMAAGYRSATRLGLRGGIALGAVVVVGLVVSCAFGGRTQDETATGEINESVVYLANAWGAQLRPPDALSRALINLSGAVNEYTDIDSKVDRHLFLDDRRIFDEPFIFITADSTFELTTIETVNLGNYLRNGGFAFIENGRPDLEYGPAEQSLRQMLKLALYDDAKFIPIPEDHPLYHCYFDFDDGPPLGSASKIALPDSLRARGQREWSHMAPYLEGIWIEKRLVAIYSDFGYGAAWMQDAGNEQQLKIGVNMVVFALAQAGGIAQRMRLELDLGEGNDFIRGNDAYENRRYEDAVKYYESFIANQPESPEVPDALYYLAESNYNMGNLPDAIETFDRLIDNYPDSGRRPLAMFQKAMALWDIRRPWNALAELQKLLEEYPDAGDVSARAAFFIGEVYASEGRYEQALEQFETVIERYPAMEQRARTRIEELREQRESNPPDESGQAPAPPVASAGTNDPRVIISGFDEVLEPAGYPFTPEQRQAILGLTPPVNTMKAIFGLFTERQRQAMVDDIRAKLAKGGGDPLNEEQVRRFMSFGPDSELEWTDLVTPEQQAAIIQADRPDAAAQQPVRPPNMNMLVTRPGIRRAAADSLNRPGSGAEPDYASGMTAFREQRYDEAVELFRRFIENNPQSANLSRALVQYAVCLESLYRYAEAETVFGRLIDEFSGSPQRTYAIQHRASILEDMGRYDEAIALQQQLINDYPDTQNAPQAAYRIGIILTRAGRFQEAVAQFEAVIERYPTIAQQARERIEELRERIGQP